MKIFLSYGHDANSPIVERLANDLIAAEHEVWIDRRTELSNLVAGKDWRRKIVDGLNESELTISCLIA